MNPMGDIGDVYTWMTNGGANISLAMTVSPFDDGTHSFGPSVKYVFHLTQYAAFPASPSAIVGAEEAKVVCTFDSNTSGQCWVLDAAGATVDFVSGDFSAAGGKTSPSGKVKVFAGRRSDPFFFNLGGFLAAQEKLMAECGTGPTDPAACPGDLALNAGFCPTVSGLVTGPIALSLSATQTTQYGPCPANQKDCFLNANVMALVVDVDKTLVTTDTNTLLGVWGSTHQ